MAIVLVVVGAVVMGITSSAFATNAQFYAASASPGSVVAGSQVTVTIRNCKATYPATLPCSSYTSNAGLGSARLSLPAAAGFAGVVSISAPSGKTWTAGVSPSDANKVELKASNSGSRLAAAQSVSVTIILTKTGVHTLATNAYYNTNLTSGPGSYAFALKGGNPSVTVTPGPLTLIFSNFTPSPGLAELNTAVPRVAGSPASVNPVTVSAADQWGNLAVDGTPITVGLTSPPDGGGLVPGPTQVVTTLAGIAAFADLKVDKVANGYAFNATTPSGVGPASSGLFNVSNDVAPCSGSSCSNSAVLPSGQTASTSLTAGGGSFNGEYLLTTFSTDPLDAPAGACDGLTTVGAGGDIAVTGGNPNSSQPTFTITLTVPAAVLNNPTKPAWRYDVCLGAKSFDSSAAPWKTKKLVNLFTRKNAIPDAENRYWGIVPRCIWVSGDPSEFFLNFLPIPASNPCIVSKTRPTGGDLTIVLRKPYPWDGRWGIGG